jgi:hypothetical protein
MCRFLPIADRNWRSGAAPSITAQLNDEIPMLLFASIFFGLGRVICFSGWAVEMVMADSRDFYHDLARELLVGKRVPPAQVRGLVPHGR